MKLRLVLVEPMHDVNVGSAARACANFGVDEIILVNPQAKLGLQAKKYAKHAWPLLQKAKRVQTIAKAVRGCSLVVGTTGVVKRFGKRSVKNCVSVEELRSKISENDAVALLFGNEGTGLSESDLKKCDFIAFVPTSDGYSVLNL
ncbi:MAG: RNA methyltransferase, partial [Candidatus Micrarchaeota archaeon]